MNGTVWIIDDDESIRWVLEKTCTEAGLNCRTFPSSHRVLDEIIKEKPNAIITDIKMPGINGLELLTAIKKNSSVNIPVIVMTAHSDLETAVNTYKLGAFDYLPKPFDIDEAILLIQRAVNLSNTSESEKKISSLTTDIIGESHVIQNVFKAIGKLSKTTISVLISGQSGTGKELVAKAIHKHSPRANSNFIALNMAAIPKELIESELFGHEKGSFTGATTDRVGRFEQAHMGTLFLDEIGDMPLDIQTRLLRVLSDKKFYKIGGKKTIEVDVRIIAATHQNLEVLIKKGLFREDLFHRLNVIRINIPSLNERIDDIPLLCNYFLEKISKELSLPNKQFTKKALLKLQTVNWKGNVRQLENVCRWLIVMTSGDQIEVEDLPTDLFYNVDDTNITDKTSSNWQESLYTSIKKHLDEGNKNIYSKYINQLEKILIDSALKHSNGHKINAANLLGMGRNTLTRKIKELKIK